MGSADAEQFNIHEAKTQLSRIIERVERGEEIVISRAEKPIAKVVPLGNLPTFPSRFARADFRSFRSDSTTP